MALSTGTRLGPYEILSCVGVGGMGEVYRAEDTRLDRIVAVKVLPAHLSEDPVRRQRLETEARAVSKLSHPHICTLYDIGRESGIDFLVMEFIEGETLADRLAKGALPPDQVLRHAVEIADALARAHRQGVVHRDLKPGNIMLTKTGAKLLDFGLAKTSASLAPAFPGLSATPTQKVPLTAEGTVVGTVQYMAPEQLEGKEADARTDLFALGAVLYEMATGRRAFEGKSQASLIAAILSSEPPPISSLQSLAPLALDRVVRHCLAKDPEERWQTAHDLMLELKWVAAAGSQAEISATAGARRITRERVFMAATLLLVLATLPLTVVSLSRAPMELHPIRSSILPPEKSSFFFSGINSGPVVVSPDGRRLAFAARTSAGTDLLWVRPLDAVTAHPLEGTDGATFPFWSADSRSIGFFADSKLKRIDVTGGPPQTLCDTSIARGGSWSQDGTIIFAPDVSESIYRVGASGGEPEPVTILDEARRQFNHRWPFFLPDGRHFLFFARSSSGESTGTYLGSLDAKEQKFLLPGRSNAIYAPPGYLLFVKDSSLMAQAFDAGRLEITGDAFPIAERVGVNGSIQRGVFSASSNGIIVFQAGGLEAGWPLFWFDRNGKRVGVLGEVMVHLFPRISPDGRRVAVQINDSRSGNADLWIYDVARGVKTRLTFDPAVDTTPVWSPDGSRIVFGSNRKGRFQLYVKNSTGVGEEEVLLEDPQADARACSWSRDGRYLAFVRRQLRGKTRSDIWIMPFFGDRKPFPFLQSSFEETAAAFSPDGRWLAYTSNESGRNEIYVTPFPGAGGKWQISSAGGSYPRWRGDGLELFYLAPDNKLMSIDIKAGGATLEMGVVRPLFQARPIGGLGGTFDVTDDGRRFLITTESEQVASEPITLVVNWTADLHR